MAKVENTIAYVEKVYRAKVYKEKQKEHEIVTPWQDQIQNVVCTRI